MGSEQNGSSRKLAFLIISGVLALVLVAVLWYSVRSPYESADQTVEVSNPAPTTETASTAEAVHESENALTADAAMGEAEPPEAAIPPAKPESSNPEEEEEGGAFVYYGRVVSEKTGKPIFGARVSIHGGEKIVLTASLDHPEAAGETDEDGQYRLEADIGSHQVYVLAEAEGFGGKAAFIIVQPGTKEKKTDFALSYGSSITGRVINEAGEPIGGATVGGVFLEQPNIQAMMQGLATLSSGFATTEEDGSFELKGIAEGKQVRLPARAKGYLPAVSDPVLAGTHEFDITLKIGQAQIHGQVFDEDGETIPGASIIVQPNQNQSMGMPDFVAITAMIHYAMSEEEGQYEFSALPEGSMVISAIKNMDQLKDEIPYSENLVLKTGDDITKDIRFKGGPVVKGRAIDAELGEGVAGVRVSNKPYRNSQLMASGKSEAEVRDRKEAISDAQGYFEVESMPMHSDQAIIYHEPPAGWIAEGISLAGIHMFQPSLAGEGIELKYRQGDVLHGIVINPEGEYPAGDATVQAVAGTMGLPLSTDTKSDGTFELTIPKVASIDILASNDHGFWSGKVENSKSDEQLEIELEAYAFISGTVSDGSGKPLSEVLVKAAPADIELVGALQMLSGQGGSTNGMGFYSVDKVPAGKVKIEATATDKNLAPKEIEITLEPGETRENVDIEMSGGDYVAGIVVNEEEEPIRGATIQYQIEGDDGRFVQPAITDGDGKFRIEGIPANRSLSFMAVMHAEYARETRQNISPFDGEQRIVMKTLPGVDLVVKDAATDQPVEHYRYRLLTKMGSMYRTDFAHPSQDVNDEEGKARLEKLEPGDWRVEVIALNEEGDFAGPVGFEEFTAGEKKAQKVEVEVQRGQQIAGRVYLNENENPVKDAKVSLYLPEINLGAFGQSAKSNFMNVDPVKSDASGKFVLSGVPAGTHQLKVEKENLQNKEDVKITVKAGENPEPLEIAMVEMGSIYGKIIGPGGEPLENVILKYRDNFVFRMEEPVINVEDDGSYQLEKMAAGAYTLSLSQSESGLSAQKHVTLKPGEEFEQDFDFSSAVEITGEATINGTAWNGQPPIRFDNSQFAEVTSNEVLSQPTVQTDGGYVAWVEPGNYVMRVNVQGINLGIQAATVTEEPNPLTMDAAIQLQPLDVVVVMPSGKSFIPGMLVLHETIPGQSQADSHSMDMNTESKRISTIQGNAYSATYESKDRSVTGKSEEIIAGEDPVLLIDVRETVGGVIGEWNPQTISTEEKVFRWDASQYITGAGDVSVTFDWERGSHGVHINNVRLIRNGQAVGVDEHLGWSGYSDRNNVYSFETTGGSDADTWEVEATLKSDGGTESTGSVLLRFAEK